jgi:dienelactone hydrolase
MKPRHDLAHRAIIASHDFPKMRRVQEAAAQDIRAALAWLNANDYTGVKLLWGSSISANLVLKVAADHPTQRVAAAVSFSPGEYHRDRPNELRSAIRPVRRSPLSASALTSTSVELGCRRVEPCRESSQCGTRNE